MEPWGPMSALTQDNTSPGPWLHNSWSGAQLSCIFFCTCANTVYHGTRKEHMPRVSIRTPWERGYSLLCLTKQEPGSVVCVEGQSVCTEDMARFLPPWRRVCVDPGPAGHGLGDAEIRHEEFGLDIHTEVVSKGRMRQGWVDLIIVATQNIERIHERNLRPR